MIASTMPLLTIHHKTEYRYAHPVAFGEHRIMLRPRDGHDLRVLSGNLEIAPEPMSLRWIHDVFGNSVAIATFDERAETLSFSQHRHRRAQSRRGVRADPGRSGVFLSVFIRRRRVSRSRSVHQAAIWRSRGRAVGVGAEFSRRGRTDPDLQYSQRHDLRHPQGFQLPQTARAGHPASARHAADEVRHLPRLRAVHDRGAAPARHRRALRIGVYFDPGSRAHGYVGGGSTHAWVQVYLPSAGWIEFDPTNGIVGTRDLVRVAVARDPRQAIPLHGTYLGSADAFVGMDVSINVVSADEGGGDVIMEIKVGFEIAYAALQPTPMVIMLSIHPSRLPISSAPRPSSPSPTCRSGSTATVSAISAAGWWRRPAA